MTDKRPGRTSMEGMIWNGKSQDHPKKYPLLCLGISELPPSISDTVVLFGFVCVFDVTFDQPIMFWNKP